jgi:hypothetical protein
MIKATDDVLFRLNRLLKKLCIYPSVNRDGYFPVTELQPYVLTGWKEEVRKVKPLFGKEREVKYITEFEVIFPKHIGTGYHGVFTEPLDYRLDRMENDRKMFISIRDGLPKLGFEIVEIPKPLKTTE